MPKRNAKPVKHKSAHDDYELPDEIDFSKTRFIGFGLEALEKHVAAKRRTVELEPDVAEEFADAAEVNEALRLVKQLREVGKKVKKKKSA